MKPCSIIKFLYKMAYLGKKRLKFNSSDRTTYYHSVKLFWIVRIPVTPLKKKW